MPGRFDDKLEIKPDGCLDPSGPLELAAGETVLKLDVWIWQERSACMAFMRNPPIGAEWAITTVHGENHVGPVFQPGAAIAMGLMVSRTADGQTKTFQWSEGISLVAGKV